MLTRSLKNATLTISLFMMHSHAQNKFLFPTVDKEYKESESIKPFFDTKGFLAHPDKVVNHLTLSASEKNPLCGFKKSTFMTPDGLQLECLVRTSEDALFSIVISAGFFPGLMTGMATLIPMLPKNCNIILYNNRGKGKSETHNDWLITRLQNYGLHEYNDVIGALDYAKSLNQKIPLALYGTCAGAFANTKALCHLKKTEKLQDYNIRAHIMDSTVTELPTTIERIPVYQRRNDCWLVAALRTLCLWTLRYTIFPRWFMTSGKSAEIDPIALAKTNIPTLHYDCKKGDLLTPHTTTNEFYQKQFKSMSENTDVCCQKSFKSSSHANHMLKKKTYASIMAGFLNKHLA